MGYRCKHCTHGLRCVIQDKPIWYCSAQKKWCPSPLFIEAWGCDNFEDIQLTLFKEERRSKHDNSHHSRANKRQNNKAS